MTTHIFIGPTISKNEVFNISEKIITHTPAKQGDIYNLLQNNDVEKIGIIDGYFECVPSVMHKEIMFAISKGVSVYGSSSMGALRAAELKDFGMIGIGYVYDLYKRNVINDDDEVAISHAPETLSYTNLSDALVNIRYTLEKALEADVITLSFAKNFIEEARSIFYKNRNYNTIFKKIKKDELKEQKEKFRKWLASNTFDIKKIDAKVLIKEMLLDHSEKENNLNYIFQDTKTWKNALSITKN